MGGNGAKFALRMVWDILGLLILGRSLGSLILEAPHLFQSIGLFCPIFFPLLLLSLVFFFVPMIRARISLEVIDVHVAKDADNADDDDDDDDDDDGSEAYDWQPSWISDRLKKVNFADFSAKIPSGEKNCLMAIFADTKQCLSCSFKRCWNTAATIEILAIA